MIAVVCVQVGNKYPFSHVVKLKNMVARNLKIDHQFFCLTDKPKKHDGIQCIDVSTALKGWWAKMNLFNRRNMPPGRILYFDLDTVIIDDISPLATLEVDFGICRNFTRAAGHSTYPCKYGSCVMSVGPDFGQPIWDEFDSEKERFILRCRYGDQEAIESIYPFAKVLNEDLPPGFFLGYRDIKATKPPGAAVVVFAGNNKPEKYNQPWIRKAWQ